ncbi:DUF1186 domain-containing protein [Labrys sp. (in: a-proteobacteria)]|uniref:DUF1186 domain-containing protein n=1 Tax=Labrys sp. (in: a-proteobacteria) TaxID=1917972 RepID=UPI0039E4BEC7
MTGSRHIEAAEALGIANLPVEPWLHRIATERTLPAVAVGACVVRIDDVAPILINLVERAAAGETLSEQDDLLLFRGLHILGGAREERAFAPLLRLLRLPPEEIERLLGDAVTETLQRIVAGCFDGDQASLFEAIRDDSIGEFVRDALLDAAVFLTSQGRIPLVDMRGLLQRFYDEEAAPARTILWVSWQQAVALLGLSEMAPLAKSLWDRKLLDNTFLSYKHFQEDLRAAEKAPDDAARFKKFGLGYIEDVLDELSGWSHEEADDEMSREFAEFPPFESANNPFRHVGRNDPCPCGSGKKFKKCCLVD